MIKTMLTAMQMVTHNFFLNNFLVLPPNFYMTLIDIYSQTVVLKISSRNEIRVSGDLIIIWNHKLMILRSVYVDILIFLAYSVQFVISTTLPQWTIKHRGGSNSITDYAYPKPESILFI